ncbi:lipase family alpha/beta hydrolase [Streptomyces sp. NPDC101151]|uniref:lipase family alpha/beta hydrolase n=1 Tax=Streptomyces sp. NPDC101151 TaxID=3366115 RepID=UPI0037F7B514
MTAPSHQDNVAERFMRGDTAARLDLARDPAAADALRGLLGRTAFEELREIAGPAQGDHLADDGPANMIFVPGVMGSYLASEALGGMWWIDILSRSHINNLALAPHGLTDIDPRFKVEPVTVAPTYTGFLAAAMRRPNLSHRTFAYDWRKPLHVSADKLHDRITTTPADASHGQPVHLVAHSMGGLVVRTALMRHPDLWNRIGKIVFLGTPHYGSPSIGGYLKNHLWGFDKLALLGRYLSRDTFRSLHGVMSLLPAPTGVYPGTEETEPGTEYDHPCANFDLYDASAWHLDLSTPQELALQDILNAAAQHHRDLNEWHLALDQNQRDRMTVIAGTGLKTLFRLAYNRRLGFLWHHMERTTARTPHNPHGESDGRVPLASAQLPYIAETRYTHTEHGKLPDHAAVQNDVWNALADKPLRLATSSAAALDDHLADSGIQPHALAMPQLPMPRTPDDPGYLDFDPPSPERLDQLEKELDAGNLPDFQRLRLL